ncbi:MAG: [citrate (pro-3S)-lyase] ligase [Lachnospiraceae bacterium]|nr:[citrate (pro-3S)-lyase] ligase [Lachnospiraceae bacterium]
MSEYFISQVKSEEKTVLAMVDRLLAAEGISRDRNLDYTCAMFDEDYNVIATGSCFKNTLRCFAVSRSHQGEGLLNQIISHLIEYQIGRGNIRLFLYTKESSSRFFGDLGFYEIARVDGTLVFMENRKNGFQNYLDQLAAESPLPENENPGLIGAVVMNANPFTNGHLYLLEKAAAECSLLHLFMVSEDASLVPFAVRKRLMLEGTAHIKNLVCHESGPYIISSATFPSYFLKDEAAVAGGHAKLDIAVFTRIAKTLGINRRYVGEEKTSEVTRIYNEIMAGELPEAGIECVVIPRKEAGGQPISASTVRVLLKEGRLREAAALLPPSTLAYFESPEAAPVLEKLRKTGDVVHH